MIGESLTKRQTARIILGLIGGLITSSCFAQSPATRVAAETTDEGIVFREGETPILAYQVKPKSKDGKFQRANYVHPLYHLNGDVVTEDFPDDHPHQRGIFWAWHQVKVQNKPAGNSWLARDFTWQVMGVATNQLDDGSARLTADVHWSSPDVTDENDKPVEFAHETTSITVYPLQQTTRTLDFDIQLKAHVDGVVIGGSDDEKGYGGFSCRFKLPDGVRFTGEKNGALTPEREAMDCGDWVSLQGEFGDSSATSGIVILVHPSSAGYPQKWILRDRQSMQNPVYPGRAPIPVATDSAVQLRYRLILHDGIASYDQLDKWHEEYKSMQFAK